MPSRIAMLSVLLLAPAVRATAGTPVCGSACSQIRWTCVTAAASTFRACREDARAAARGEPRRKAFAACRSAFHAARSDCPGRVGGCLQTCRHLPPGSCIQDCVDVVRACIAKAVADGRACLRGCPIADDPVHCRADCAQMADAGTHECGTAFGACSGACVASPTGAFVD